jgi:type II secretory ATPase GspE/PulE/Tfp pilus assembly ATPase PilB-like protein
MPEATLKSLAHLWRSGASVQVDEAELLARWRRRFGGPDGQLQRWTRVGCRECDGSGYRGRLGLHELLVADEHLRELVRHRADASKLQEVGIATGMATLRQDGIEKVLAGATDLPEVVAATNP